MFTGIVEETGSIRSLRLSGSSGKIAIRAKKVLGGTRIGDSIAVNGSIGGSLSFSGIRNSSRCA